MTTEPACWSWVIPDELRITEADIPRLMADQAHLPEAEQRPESSLRYIVRLTAAGCYPVETDRFDRFHAGRCAICGRGGGHRVEDHCHDTGQVRGYLCRSCNVIEGRSTADLFENYRRRHPAAILDYHEPYTGRGWRGGWSLVEHRAGTYEWGPRPATAWPSWSGE